MQIVRLRDCPGKMFRRLEDHERLCPTDHVVHFHNTEDEGHRRTAQPLGTRVGIAIESLGPNMFYAREVDPLIAAMVETLEKQGKR